MPVSSRNEVAGKHREQRRESSPYSQHGRRDKMAASRGWRPSIWKALTFWKSEPPPSSDEDSDSLEDIPEQKSSKSGKDAEIQEGSGGEDSSNTDVNSSTVSEDQVFRQLISPTPRQVRFEVPRTSLDSRRISPPQPPAPFTFRRQPYVAPLPPSGILSNKTGSPYKDPLAKVSEYLDTVVLPRGGECTDVEALGLSMLIQSSVKGSPSRTSTPSRDASPNRNPFVFPTHDTQTPLKPTFTAPNTDFASIFSRPDSPSTSTTRPTSSPSRPLTRNPNGSISFQGGGSAKPRYRSSAFGTPSPRKKVTFPRDFGDSKSESALDTVSSPSDGKRRRVGEESYTSIAQPSGPSFQTSSSSSLDSDSQPSREGPNGHGVSNNTSRDQPSAGAPPSTTTTLRFGTSAARFVSTTPARPSPLRQSMRADSSSPGSPNSNQSSPDVKVNGNVAKPGHAKALAIFAEIVSSASQSKDEKTIPSNADLVNPYDTRPPTKRARKPAKPARAPPPRPTRRTVSVEAPSPPPESPKKPTALETIEKTAPPSVQAKRMHADMNGHSETSTSKRRDQPVQQEVIEIDDEEPVPKRVKAENPKSRESSKESVEIIDVDGDVDMNGPVSDSTTSVLRPSEVVEPTEAERAASSKPAPQRALYPSSLSKGPRFGSVPKEPSPLRNSFQPETEARTNTSTNMFSQPESKTATSGFFGSTASTTTTTTIPAFSMSSTTDESTKAPTVPKTGFGSTATTSSSTFGVISTSEFSFGKTSTLSSSSMPFTFSAFKSEATSTENKTSKPTSSGFSFGQTVTASPSSFAATAAASASTSKPVSFGTNAIPPTTTPSIPVPSNVDDVETIKKTVLALKEFELPVFKFNSPIIMNGTVEHSAERAAALRMSENSLPTFTFDTKAKAMPKLGFDQGKPSAPVPATTEIKGFDWSGAGIKPPVSSGWTCSVCCVPNKDADPKCVCCGEDKP